MPDPITPYPPSDPGGSTQTQIQQEQQNDFLGPVNGALGGLPVAEKNQSYFVTYKGAGGTGPEIIDQTAVFITNLIDFNGNISKPSEDYNSLYNLIQNFEIGKNIIVRNNLGSETNNQIEGKQLITGIGRQETILFSQTGSSQGANIDELNIYPNPAANNLSVDYRAYIDGKVVIELYDISGRKVYSKHTRSTLGKNMERINVSNLNSGMYMLRLVVDGSAPITSKVQIIKN